MPTLKSRTMPNLNGLPKSQRLTGRNAVGMLFQNGNSRSVTWHPIRAVYRPNSQPCHRMLVTASKHLFRHAVDRNRIKRQVREAYRLNKHILQDLDTHLDIAFIWLSNHHKDSQAIASGIRNILNRIYTTTCTSSGQSL